MDLFRFHNPNDTLKMESGEIVNRLLSIEWIDRYREAGEFTVTARAESGIFSKLPIGCFVGLVGNKGLMRVEDHQLADDQDKSVVKVTGRSYEAFLENRIIGNDQVYPSTDGNVKYALNSLDPTWEQAVNLIKGHVTAAGVSHQPLDIIPYLEAMESVSGLPDTREGRELARKSLYAGVIELLEVNNCGLKVYRPWTLSYPTPDSQDSVVLLIHRGVDRRDSVVLSYDSGEIDSADYLWSDRKYKNCALVTGKWVEVLVNSYAEGIDRRMMVVDATDIDGDQEAAPTGPALGAIAGAMEIRGKEALARQKKTALANVNLTKGPKAHVYGVHYDIGDIITVRGNFQEAKPMRVTEYVHIEDETGVTGYPTLEDLETENA